MVHQGRYTAAPDGEFVLFLIGMRINKPLRVRQWLPVFAAMRPMVAELREHPERGLLHAQFALIGGCPAVVQYWRSFEALERFARDPDDLHLPAWKRWNRLVRASGDVGIWHETYRVRAGEYEAIYGNMPRVGLAAVGDHRPIGTTSATAARRIRLRPDDVAPVDGY